MKRERRKTERGKKDIGTRKRREDERKREEKERKGKREEERDRKIPKEEGNRSKESLTMRRLAGDASTRCKHTSSAAKKER